MNLITLTAAGGSKVLINADRIDGAIVEQEGYLSLYVGGSEQPFVVKESTDEVKSICEHGVTMDVSKLHPSSDLMKLTVISELNRRLKVVSEALTNIMEHENYDFGYSEAADIAEEVIKNE